VSEERSFAPTARRLERAAEEGDVARSGEAVAVASFAAGAAALSAALAPMLAAGRALVAASLAQRRLDGAACAQLLAAAASVPCAAAGAALATALAQTRFALRLAPLAPRWDRLEPGAGLKRMLSRESVLHALRWSATAAVIALCGLQALRGAIGRDLADDPAAAVDAARAVCAAYVWPALALGAVGAALEYATARGARLRRLRMSREEVKRELRESEGDPQRKVHRARLQRSMRGDARAMRGATVLVTNPTHVAVALRYDPEDVPVPAVVSKGCDRRAAALRALAARYGVPVVEEVWLARALYAEVAVGEPIPESAFGAVAAVIAAIAHEGRARGGRP